MFLDAMAAKHVAASRASSLQDILRCALAELRCVHYAPLDVYDDRGLRVLQVITALQRGGAERVTLDLVAELPAQNVRVRLATLGRPSREAFPAPPGTLHLGEVPGNAVERNAALVRHLVELRERIRRLEAGPPQGPSVEPAAAPQHQTSDNQPEPNP